MYLHTLMPCECVFMCMCVCVMCMWVCVMCMCVCVMCTHKPHTNAMCTCTQHTPTCTHNTYPHTHKPQYNAVCTCAHVGVMYTHMVYTALVSRHWCVCYVYTTRTPTCTQIVCPQAHRCTPCVHTALVSVLCVHNAVYTCLRARRACVCTCRTLLQSIVFFIGLFCKRDL